MDRIEAQNDIRKLGGTKKKQRNKNWKEKKRGAWTAVCRKGNPRNIQSGNLALSKVKQYKERPSGEKEGQKQT